MQVDTCIRDMCASAHVSMRSTSARLGRAPAYVRLAGMPGASPALATVATVADALGYDLVVRDRRTGDDVGTIEAPRRAGAEDPPAGATARD